MKERGNRFLKFFDRWVGPVVLWLIAFVRSERQPPAQMASVGLLKPAAIGDLVLVSALISDLRRWSPQLKIVLFVSSSNFEYAKLLQGVDHLVCLPMAQPMTAIKMIREYPVNLMIDFDSWPRITALLCALSRADWKLGFFTRKQFRHFAFDQTVEHSNEQHEIENYRSLLRSLNIPVGSPPQNLAQLKLDRTRRNQIAIHMYPGGTLSHLKEWPSQRWLELMMKIRQKAPSVHFVITGGPGDAARARRFLDRAERDLRDHCTICAGSSLKETIQDLVSCRALISVNTGIMHLGASLGVPTIGLHGPTNPKRWGPVGSPHQFVLSKHPGAACLNLGFEYDQSESVMLGIAVDDVQEALSKMIGPLETKEEITT